MDVATIEAGLSTPQLVPTSDITGVDSGITSAPEANDSEMPDATSPQAHTTTVQQISQLKKKKKQKRYSPPQPDANTFRTQQEFLGSLNTIPIETVDPNSRKCPVCWKPFGEAADPGFDNSEEPVRLRCDHVFGNKCLNNTYALQGTSNVKIRPLSFYSKSKGSALGRKLHTYAKSNNMVSTSKSKTETFSGMVEESFQPERGTQIFGDHWWPVIRQLQSGTHDLAGVTLLDNAVILDRKQAKPKGPEISSKKLIETPGGYEVCLPGVAVHPATTNDSPHGLPPPSGFIHNVGVPAYELSAEPTMFGLNWGQQQAFFSEAVAIAPSHTTSTAPMQIAPPFLPASWTTTPIDEASLTMSVQQPASTWEEALAEKQTQLDKLIAKKEEIKGEAKVEQSDMSEEAKQQLITQQQALQQASEREKLAEMHKQAQEAQASLKREAIRHLGVELARIYRDYHSQLPAEQEQDIEQETMAQDPPRLLPTSVTVHKKDLDSTSYNIRSLDQYLSMEFYGGGDDSDDEVDDEEEQQALLSKTTLIITRTICTSCCQISDKKAAALEPLTSLWWKNDRKVPDDCPICHKVLFYRGRHSSSRRPIPAYSDDDSEASAV